MATEVIYARVPEALKKQVEEYGARKAMSTTTAVVDLLERGMESVSNVRSIARLEQRASQLEEELGSRTVELQEVRLQVSSLEDRLGDQRAAYRGLTQRTEQVVGTCPTCRKPIRGYDLLVTGHCSECATPVTTLLAGPGGTGGLDQKEVLLLLGAIGLVVGIAYLQSKG